MVSEEALKNSFANVKREMMQIQAQLLELSAQQAEIFGMIQSLDAKKLQSKKTGSRKSKRSSKKKR